MVIGMFFLGLFKRFNCDSKRQVDVMFGNLGNYNFNEYGAQTEIRYASVAGTFTVLLALFCVEVNDARSV